MLHRDTPPAENIPVTDAIQNVCPLVPSGYEAGALPSGAPQPLAKPFGADELATAVGTLFGRKNPA
jgi:hypothetical protein